MKKTIYLVILVSAFILPNRTRAQVFPYSDDFESYSSFGGSLTSGGWTSSGLGFACYSGRGIFNSKSATKNLFSLSTQKDSMTSKLIGPLTSSSKLFFSHRFIEGGTCNCIDYTLNPGDKLTVSISTNGTSFTNLKTFDSSNDDGVLAYKTDSINLSVFAGINVRIKFVVYRGPSASSDFKLDLDNIVIQDTPLNVKQLPNTVGSFYLFPNPATKQVYLQVNFPISTEAYLSIVNILGKEVFTHYLDKSKSELDLGALDRGIYFLKINFSSRIYQEKIVLE